MRSLEIQENVDLAPYTTIGVGGPARFFAHVRAENELQEAVAFARKNRLPLFALGGGSNLLVHDDGFPGLVVHLDLAGAMQIERSEGTTTFRVPAGCSWEEFVLAACTRDLSGVECLAGIPGLTGGTPVQNVGAYGQEVSQTIRSVRAFDLHQERFVDLDRAVCGFGYRTSIFNNEARHRYFVTAVVFALKEDVRPAVTYVDLKRRFPDKEPSPLEIYGAVREIRRSKGMLITEGDPDSRSAGSFFKNPLVGRMQFAAMMEALHCEASSIPHWPASADDAGESSIKLAAAWLVERAGFPKGFILGQAGISSRHALALINRGAATFADIARLRDLIRGQVCDRFSINLVQEPVELSPAWTGSHARHWS